MINFIIVVVLFESHTYMLGLHLLKKMHCDTLRGILILL